MPNKLFTDQKILAVIPARIGSKRIPKKNIVDFLGKPMIQWTIEQANQSDCFDKVFVSTDSEEISKIAKANGADCPVLRTDAADDLSPISEATLSAVNQSESLWGKFDIVVQLMANCPLREASQIKNSIDSFISNNFDSQISFFKYGFMNPWWAHEIKNNIPKPIFEESINQRSQDLPDLYCPTGAIWISKVSSLYKHKTFYAPNHGSFIMDWISAIDIDDYNDLEMAKALFGILHKRDKNFNG